MLNRKGRKDKRREKRKENFANLRAPLRHLRLVVSCLLVVKSFFSNPFYLAYSIYIRNETSIRQFHFGREMKFICSCLTHHITDIIFSDSTACHDRNSIPRSLH